MAEEQPKVEEKTPEAPKITHLQHIIVTLVDGRRGVFAGPMMVTNAELMLKPPRISEVVICQPRPLEPEKEPTDGNPKADEKGA